MTWRSVTGFWFEFLGVATNVCHGNGIRGSSLTWKLGFSTPRVGFTLTVQSFRWAVLVLMVSGQTWVIRFSTVHFFFLFFFLLGK